MDFVVRDFQNAEGLIHNRYSLEWGQLEDVLQRMPLHVKASTQREISGNLIFDPVATNAYLERELRALGWANHVPIPAEFNFLGTDIDFVINGMLVEAQFSNYPFLLNNTVRSDLLRRAQQNINGDVPNLLVMLTKIGLLPASNSTLYLEQAERQLTALGRYQVFEIPIRVVGFSVNEGDRIPTRLSIYPDRYSRAPESSENITCVLDTTRRRTLRRI